MLSVLPYFLANVSLNFVGSIFRNFLYSRTIPLRWPRAFIWGFTGFFTTLWTINSYAFPNGTALLDLTIILLFTFGAPCFAEKGYRLKGLLTSAIFLAIEVTVMNLIALIAFPIAQKLGYPPEYLVDRTTSFGNAIMILICFSAVDLVTWGASRILKQIFEDWHFSVWILCFLPIPISQGVIINLISRIRPFAESVLGLDTAFVAAFLLSVAADMAFLYGISRIQKAERLRRHVQSIEEQLTIQKNYYQKLQENILAVNQIRHDLTNQLQTAYALLEQGETSSVRSHLDQIQSGVQNRIGPRFCPNLLVDAVLSEKARLCQEHGIRLDINAQLPQELPMESTRLCSAFSNLLDNSIQAVQSVTTCEKYIELHTALHTDYLIICCINPTAASNHQKPSKNPLRLHGLGLDILHRIAQEYHGSLETACHDGLFEASLVLKFTK